MSDEWSLKGKKEHVDGDTETEKEFDSFFDKQWLKKYPPERTSGYGWYFEVDVIEILRQKLIEDLKQWAIDFEIEGVVFQDIHPIDRFINRINKRFGVEK